MLFDMWLLPLNLKRQQSDEGHGLCAWNRLQSPIAHRLSVKHMNMPSEFAKAKAIVTVLLQSM